jgi:hypothetical protein
MRPEEIAFFEKVVEVVTAMLAFWVVVFPGPGDGELSGESGSPKRISVAGFASTGGGQANAPNKQTRINNALMCPDDAFFSPMEALMAFQPLLQYRRQCGPGGRSREARDSSETWGHRGQAEVQRVGRNGR